MRVESLHPRSTPDLPDLNTPLVREQLVFQACNLHQQGDTSSAERLYREAVQVDPNQQNAWRNLGALLRQQGKIQEARHCTEQALRLDSSDGSLWGNYGNVLRDQDLLEESCKAFEEGSTEPWCDGLLRLSDQPWPSQEHRQVVELLAPVADDALRLLNHGDNSLAELLLEPGNAHHHLERKIKPAAVERGYPWAEGDKRLFIGLNIAQVLCGDRQFAEATKLCQELEPLFPENENLVYAQGVIARGTGELERAADLFERALQLNPAYPICLNTYGLLLRDIGRTHQSRHCFNKP